MMNPVSIVFSMFLLLLSVSFPAMGFAKCTEELMKRLLDNGFSKAEILQLCADAPGSSPSAPGGGAAEQHMPAYMKEFVGPNAQPPAKSAEEYLSGVWQVSQQSSSINSIEKWKIEIQGNSLSITTGSINAIPGQPLPMDYSRSLAFQQARFENGQFQITFQRMNSVTVKYDLRVIDPKRMEGSFSQEDTWIKDIGIGQGVLKEQGKVVMIKQQ